MRNDIKQGISTSMDCLHASEDTYEEVMNVINNDARKTRAQVPRGAWSWAKVAAVALAAVLVIGTGAYATATGWFANMFGTHGYTDVEPEDHGKGVQYFDVSEEAAAALVGDKFNNVDQVIEHDGYVLTVHGYVVDENGCAIGWATLSNENGLRKLYGIADGHLFKGDFVLSDENGPFKGVCMTSAAGGNDMDNHAAYIDRATATDTSLDLVFYYASYDCETPDAIEFRMAFSEETWGAIDTVVKTDPLAAANVLDAVDCGGFSVSPISIKCTRNAMTMHNLSLMYADGSEQLIVSDDYYNVMLDTANTDHEHLYMPTALLNTDELVSVNLSDREWDSRVIDYVFTPAE